MLAANLLILIAPAGLVPGQGPPPLDAKTQLWTLDLQAPSFGSAAAADLDGDGAPELLFGTYYRDEHFYCVDGRTGTVRWKRKSAGGPLDAAPLIADLDGNGRLDVVYADSAYGTMWCVNAAGQEIWTHAGPSGTDSPPAAADLDGDGKLELIYGTMKVRGGDGRVIALEGATGRERWSVAVPGHVQSEPALTDLDGDALPDVLVTNWMGDGRLRALRGLDGKELWSFVTGDWIYHGVSVHDFDGDGGAEIVVADRRGTVWMLGGAGGAELWKTHLEGEREGSVFGPTTLVDADGKGAPEIAVAGVHLHLLDAHGKLRWRREHGVRSITRGAAAADLDGDGREDLVYGTGATLYAVRARDGKELWAWTLRSGDSLHEDLDQAPLVLDLDGDGRLDVFTIGGAGTSEEGGASNYGRAWALRAGKGKAVPEQTWTTFRGSNLRLGRRAPPVAAQEPPPAAAATASELSDHHVHLLGPDLLRDWKSLGVPFSRPDADYLSAERFLGPGGALRRVALISMAHFYGNEELRLGASLSLEQERARAAAENDHVAREAARWPGRAAAFASADLLRPYALEELQRARRELRVAGAKIHLGSAAFDPREEQHMAALVAITAWCAAERMPLLLHLDPQRRGLDVEHARLILDRALGPHPELIVIVAHLGGSGGFGPWTRRTLETCSAWLEEEARAGRPRPGVFFDLSAVPMPRASEGVPPTTEAEYAALAPALRRLGLQRCVFASDAPVFDPAEQARLWRERSGLDAAELERLFANVVPGLFAAEPPPLETGKGEE